MHAIGGPEVLRLDEVGMPEPGPGQVLVKVATAGVTYGDVMKRRGAFGDDLPLPSGLGLEVAGTVTARGPGVSAPAEGTRVTAWVADGADGYAEYALARATEAIPIPDAVDFRSAAALPVQGVTAYQTVRDAGALMEGESVFVHAAAGGVGGLAVQVARLWGAGVVVGGASRPDKLDHVRGLGATAVDTTGADWPRQVLEVTGGRGVDLVLDSVGGEAGARSLECLAPFGRLVGFGAAGGSPTDASGISLMHGNLSFIGYSLHGWRQRPDRVGRAVKALLRQLTLGRLDVPVAQALPLEKAEVAHRAIEERRTIGTTVLLNE